MAEFKNVFIYVSDALRYDHVPESIAAEGKVVPTLAPGAYTPISFSSLATGLSPENHSVRSFYDTLEQPTIFDIFEHSCYYDHPDDSMTTNVFGNYGSPRELEDMEQPFFYVERALDTHAPYGQVHHGNRIPSKTKDFESIHQGYREGVKSTEEHFWNHVEKLEEIGILDETLVIFTSDHGEFLDERLLFRTRSGHDQPLAKQVSVVPTVFLNHDADYERMRSIDIAPTAASLTGREFNSDGLNLDEDLPDRGRTMIQVNRKPLVAPTCTWHWKEGGWRRGISGLKTDIATLAFDILDPLKSKVRNSRLRDFLVSRNQAPEEPSELEGLEV